MMPALLVWGMRHGSFAEDSKPQSLSEVAEATGYSREQVYEMCALIDRLVVHEADNEVADIDRDR